MKDYPFKPEIAAAAQKHGLNPLLVAAICSVESSFNTNALRYEPKFRLKYIEPNPKYSKMPPETRTLLSSSIGLMQVLGVVAHEDGLPITWLYRLFNPLYGLEYGCIQLKQLFKKYGKMDAVIAAYNAGSPRMGKNGYVNQGYVDKVMKFYGVNNCST